MTLEQQARWNDAVAEFREAALVNEKLGDTLGVSYCEHGVARVLLKLNRPSEALAFADRAKRHVDRATDPRHLDEVSITRATILAAGLGRATEARQELAEAEASVRSRRNPPLGGCAPMPRRLPRRASGGMRMRPWPKHSASRISCHRVPALEQAARFARTIQSRA
ncbi:MAG: hypothetical protein U0163_09480 [Gemmatimonadaceae bacterium]